MIDKNIVSLKANYLADTMQKELMKKTIWSNVSIVSYNIPLIETLSVSENIILPLQYFENIRKKNAENIALDMLKVYNMTHTIYYKPKKLNDFEILIVKYLRASIRTPKHIFFFLPHRMLLTDDYSLFTQFISKINKFTVTVVENFRYFSEYKNLNFKEIPYHLWQTLVLKI